MKRDIDRWVSITLIALIVVGYVMMVLALPIAEFFLIPGIVAALTWILVVRPNLFKEKK